jgi:LacI family transcriptional regulator, gluconate utilization system Gnt-I transcriptional repressor
LGSSRGTPGHSFGSATIFINSFWQRCQQQIGSAAKKTLLLGESGEKWW